MNTPKNIDDLAKNKDILEMVGVSGSEVHRFEKMYKSEDHGTFVDYHHRVTSRWVKDLFIWLDRVAPLTNP